MTSEPSAPGLGAQLRAVAHHPEDDAAARLRAKLRHKMFGVERPTAVAPPEVPVEPRRDPSTSWTPLIGWVVPSAALATLAGVMLIQRARPPELGVPSSPSTMVVSHPDAGAPVEQNAEPVRDDGPALLDASRLVSGDEHLLTLESAIRASWADAAARERVEATVEFATITRRRGDVRRGIDGVRAILDDMELAGAPKQARAILLEELAKLYGVANRPQAAAAVRQEARRLTAG